MKTPKYEDALAKLRASFTENAGCGFDYLIQRYDSPIEKVFLGEMLCHYWTESGELPYEAERELVESLVEFGLERTDHGTDTGAWVDSAEKVYSLSHGPVFCATQPWMQLAGRRIRPDFAFVLPGENETRIIVELDGHDFHERTPDQAQSDKSRDRELQALGWHVMRFTGREVLRDSGKCLTEVHQLLFAKRSLAWAKAREGR